MKAKTKNCILSWAAAASMVVGYPAIFGSGFILIPAGAEKYNRGNIETSEMKARYDQSENSEFAKGAAVLVVGLFLAVGGTVTRKRCEDCPPFTEPKLANVPNRGLGLN